jgi:multiple sugar transport system permease protein
MGRAMSASVPAGTATSGAGAAQRKRNYARHYWPFVVPAGLVVFAVIVFPWIFTLYMSAHEFKVGSDLIYVGFRNYIQLATDERFLWSIVRTLYFTLLATFFPVVLGVAAAVVFHRKFPLRGLARTIFILPMMATPVAVALVWTMMFHPQLGVLNYLLTSVGLPPSQWSYSPETVIPTLVMVETWQWTPLVMLIVLGGLASLPTDPYEAARLDGASGWAMFWHISLPLVWPHIIVALVIRTIDALKAFDLIFVISNGGPGTASETMNIYLYLQAFSFFNMGYASAVTVVFFIIILLVSLILFSARRQEKWQ